MRRGDLFLERYGNFIGWNSARKSFSSMTINSPAAIIWAMYLAAAENKGVRLDQLRGTTQNDILKEFIAQKEFIFPPEPSMRLVVDTMEFGAQKVPQWNTISISGYHIREAGSTGRTGISLHAGRRVGIRPLGNCARHGRG
jgi:methylmalonyl-CoA mutase N-terminal domain/subunit